MNTPGGKNATPFRSQLILPGVSQILRLSSEDFSMGNYTSGSEEIESMNTHKLLLVTVGLPARGKTYISQKLVRYLEWLGLSSKAFSTNLYRAQVLGKFYNHHWFQPDNVKVVFLSYLMIVFLLM